MIWSCVYRYIAAGIIEVTFGHEVLSDDDYFLKMANNVNDILGGAGVPGTSVLDVFPVCESCLLICSLLNCMTKIICSEVPSFVVPWSLVCPAWKE